MISSSLLLHTSTELSHFLRARRLEATMYCLSGRMKHLIYHTQIDPMGSCSTSSAYKVLHKVPDLLLLEEKNGQKC